MTPFRNPLRQHPPALRKLMVGEMAGLLAGTSTQATLAWWIAQAGGVADIARYGAAMALCALLALPLMSPLGDRWPKHQVVRCARAVLLVETLALVAMAWMPVYSWSVLCLCGALSAVAHAALLPAQASLCRNSSARTSCPGRSACAAASRPSEASRPGLERRLAGVAGPGRGHDGCAAADGGRGSHGAMRLDAPGTAVGPRRAGRVAGRRARRTARQRGVPVDRWWTLTGALMMVFFLPATGLLLPLRIQSLGLSAGWFGACGAALSIGVMAGVAGLAGALIERLDRVRAMAAAIGVCGCAVGAAGLCDHPMALVGCSR